MEFAFAGYGTRGDVEPAIAAGRELLRRGHEVRIAVPPGLVGLAESAGLAAVAYGRDPHEQISAAAAVVRRIDNSLIVISELIERVNRAWAEKSATLTALASGADLLVGNLNEPELAANVAEYHGIPLAELHVFPARILPSGSTYSRITKAAVDAQRRALGLPGARPSWQQTLEIQAYDELCLPGPAAEWVEPNGRRPFVGALTLELPTDADDEVSEWIAAGTPPVYFGFGSTALATPSDTVAMISAASARLGERALICGGVSDFSGLPHCDHVKLVCSLNYAAAFPACRAVVHHGGAGTMAAGLRAGVPSLILWGMWDQPMWATALEQLEVGCGRQLSATTQESLVADLRCILTPECAARARSVAVRMSRPAESVALTADLLEQAIGLGRVHRSVKLNAQNCPGGPPYR